MNRLTIKTATPDGCIVCGDLGQIRVDISDYLIVGVYPCPACVDPEPVREFRAPLLDYLTRPQTPGPVIA